MKKIIRKNSLSNIVIITFALALSTSAALLHGQVQRPNSHRTVLASTSVCSSASNQACSYTSSCSGYANGTQCERLSSCSGTQSNNNVYLCNNGTWTYDHWVQNGTCNFCGAPTPKPTQQPTPTPTPMPTCNGLTIATATSLDRTTVVQGATINGSVTYKNNCVISYSIQTILIASRDSANNNKDFWPSINTTTVNPGQTITLHTSRTISSSDPTGTWTAYASYEDTNDNWHEDSNILNFTVSAPSPTPTPTLKQPSPPSSAPTATPIPTTRPFFSPTPTTIFSPTQLPTPTSTSDFFPTDTPIPTSMQAQNTTQTIPDSTQSSNPIQNALHFLQDIPNPFQNNTKQAADVPTPLPNATKPNLQADPTASAKDQLLYNEAQYSPNSVEFNFAHSGNQTKSRTPSFLSFLFSINDSIKNFFASIAHTLFPK